jgi:hypothetical protein
MELDSLTSTSITGMAGRTGDPHQMLHAEEAEGWQRGRPKQATVDWQRNDRTGETESYYRSAGTKTGKLSSEPSKLTVPELPRTIRDEVTITRVVIDRNRLTVDRHRLQCWHLLQGH